MARPARKYQVIRDHLRTFIAESRFAPHTLLPSELSLVARYGASRPTIRRAMDLLVQEGVIYRTPGRGAFVAPGIGRCEEEMPGLVGLVVHEPRLEHLAGAGPAILECLHEAGWRLELATSRDDPHREEQVLRRMAGQGVRGVLITPTRFGENLPRYGEILGGVPFVVIERCPDEAACDYVALDEQGAIARAVELLVARGHRAIGYVGVHDYVIGWQRFEGFRRGLRAFGLMENPAWIGLYDPYKQPHAAYESAVRALSRSPRPTAFVCCNDGVAREVQRAAQDLGLVCPRDLALVGFDNLPYLALGQGLDLTTFDRQLDRVAREAVRILLARIADPRRPVEQLRLPARLIERGSTPALAVEPLKAG